MYGTRVLNVEGMIPPNSPQDVIEFVVLVFSDLSLAYSNVFDHFKGGEMAKECIRLKPAWAEGYMRLGGPRTLRRC